jgi:UMP-CMP kinase
MGVLKKAMLQKHSDSRKFLIDGFPRNFENLKGWIETFGSNDQIRIKFALYFDCPESEMEKRLIKRGETSGRDDDNVEAIKKRFRTFMQETIPVIEYFEKKSLLKTVKAVGTQEDVFSRVIPYFHCASSL